VEVPKQEVILPRKTALVQRLLSDKEGAIDAVRRQPGQVQF
jgi:hypothetical protein